MKTGEKQTNPLKIMNNFLIPAKLILLCFYCHLSQKACAITPETQEKLNDALGNWRSYDSEKLKLPSNEDLKQELLKIAENPDKTGARVILIRMGNKEIIHSTLELYKNSPLKRLGNPVNQLSLGANPIVIPELIESLMIEEEPDSNFDGGSRILTPKSILASDIIISIVETNSAFKPQMRAWAQKLPLQSAERRAACRQWWIINKEALLRKDYAACVPVPVDEREIKGPAKSGVSSAPEAPLFQRGQKERPFAPPEDYENAPRWPWLAGITMLAVIAMIIWSRRG